MTESDKRPPVVGSFKDPSKKNQNGDTVVATPASKLAEGVQSDIKKDVEDNKDTVVKAQGYQEILAEAEITIEKAHAIIDDLLTKGYYEEVINITKTTTVTFRTRTQSDYRRYLRAVEVVAPKYVDEQQEIQLRYFLAASLVEFKGQRFDYPKHTARENEIEDAFEKRMSWIKDQPDSLITLLAVKLSKFDRTVKVVMSEGVIENF
jgi:hypothetical protein